MTNGVNAASKVSSGLCPHGMSPGACPICSGMGGGSTRVGERPQKAGEMSYHQCAMIGAMMRAREARLEAHEQNLQARTEALQKFEQQIINFSLWYLTVKCSTWNINCFSAGLKRVRQVFPSFSVLLFPCF